MREENFDGSKVTQRRMTSEFLLFEHINLFWTKKTPFSIADSRQFVVRFKKVRNWRATYLSPENI